VIVAPTPEFYRWSFASMWVPGPFEQKATRAYYDVTDADPSWPADKQEEHLRDFNYPTLWSISIHEVYPGHFLHYQFLRRVESKVRKSIMFAPASFVEGWAHYTEQMMVEAGFRRDDHTFKLGQLAEALIRLGRFIVSIRLHVQDWSVEQGVRFFRDECFMEESSARREAERGTFDPTYLVYSVGKLMLLKLRRDYKDSRARNTARVSRSAVRPSFVTSRCSARAGGPVGSASSPMDRRQPLLVRSDACAHKRLNFVACVVPQPRRAEGRCFSPTFRSESAACHTPARAGETDSASKPADSEKSEKKETDKSSDAKLDRIKVDRRHRARNKFRSGTVVTAANGAAALDVFERM
jgi:hypothetical protein